MTNDENNEDIIVEDLPTINDGEEDNTDWKALALKNHGIAKRAATKLAKAKDGKPADATPADKKEGDGKADGLDRMDRAILRVEKITAEDEVNLVQSIMKDTGKSLEQVLESKYFQSELKEMRELNATKDATPDGTKRAGQSTRDTVDYWLAKGELPPAEQVDLRRKVVNAKIAKEKSGNQFSSNPLQ